MTEFCMPSALLKHPVPVPFIQLATGIWCATEYTSRYLRHGGVCRVLNRCPILANQHPLCTNQQRMTSYDIMSANRVKRDTTNPVSCSNFSEPICNGWHRIKLCRRA